MKIECEAVLDKFRGIGKCELCGRMCQRREPHHHQRRGHGGGYRLDVSIALVSVGAVFHCPCHERIHAGALTSEQVLAVIAKREGATVAEVREAIWVLVRLPKRASWQEIEEALAEVSDTVAAAAYAVAAGTSRRFASSTPPSRHSAAMEEVKIENETLPTLRSLSP